MNVMRRVLGLALLFAALGAAAFEYNVRMPSEATRPRWRGARVGEWTMDYASARSQAIAEGRGMLVLVTGSWWCPHCEAFEEKVLLDHAAQWRNYIQEKGYYLVMLDFPYRVHVTDDQLWKSRYPEYGDGWGFQCWLYDEDYLGENGLSKEDGLNAIMDLYRLQKSLAPDSATQMNIKTWDGSEDFSYGKVGYPSLIVYLPNGNEAGRFSPGSTYRESDEAYQYVIEKLDAIVREALDEECGLCSEPEAWGLSGARAEVYRGWITEGTAGVVGTFEAKTGTRNAAGDIRISATVTVDGKKRKFDGVGHDCCIDTVVLKGKGDTALELMFDANGVRGAYAEGGRSWTVTGALDVFKTRDPEAKARRKLVTAGTWTFAMAVTNAPSEFARGYGSFSVKVAKSGTATLRGVLPDGTAVSATGKAVVGDSDSYCIPFSVSTRRGGFGCCLWFKNGWLFNVADIRAWESAAPRRFTAGWRAIYSATAGFGEVKDEFELVLPDVPETIGGNPVVDGPDGDMVTVRKSQWTGTEASKFRAQTTAKTGLLAGSMKFVVQKGGSLRSVACKVSGALIDGTAYCTAVAGRHGSFAVKVSACDACEDD